MTDKRIPKKFKTSWGVEYTVHVTDTSDSSEDTKPSPEPVSTNETNNIKMKDIALLIIAIGMIAFCINFKSEHKSITIEDGATPYEQFPDSYENSSFNPDNGYIGNTHER